MYTRGVMPGHAASGSAGLIFSSVVSPIPTMKSTGPDVRANRSFSQQALEHIAFKLALELPMWLLWGQQVRPMDGHTPSANAKWFKSVLEQALRGPAVELLPMKAVPFGLVRVRSTLELVFKQEERPVQQVMA